MLSQPSLPAAGQVMLLALAVIAAIYDVRFRRIPNRLVLAGLVAGLAWNTYLLGLPGLEHSAAGLGLGFLLYFPLYLLHARGAGDVKLLAAVGAIVGSANCIWIFLSTAILGGFVTLIWVMVHGRGRRTLFNVGWIMRDLSQGKAPWKSNQELDVASDKGARLPHAVLLLLGVVSFILVEKITHLH